MIYFDIETGPLPEADLLGLMPEFEANKNLKDPAKIEANIAEKRAEWLANAALDAGTGRVLAIGVINIDGEFMLHAHADEADTLTAFWDDLGYLPHAEEQWAGWNIFGFDLPFLVRRSWIIGLSAPLWLRNGRHWDVSFVDLMDVYGLPSGGRADYISLDSAARALHVGRKNGKGTDFAKLWFGTAEQRSQAIDYLRNDLFLTRGVGMRILGGRAV